MLYATKGLPARAEPLCREALKIRLGALGERHPSTADSFNNLGMLHEARRQYPEAEAMLRRALAVYREARGEKHPDVARTLNNLAFVASCQGRFAEAEALYRECTRSFEASRLTRAKTLERGIGNGGNDPWPRLASTSADLGKHAEAFRALELDFARGMLDEAASRRGAALSPPEKERRNDLAARIEALQQRIGGLVSDASRDGAGRKELADLGVERRKLDDELADLAAGLSQREVADLDAIRGTIPADAALVTWVDVSIRDGRLEEHWACVVRRTGEPKWVRLPGTGPNGLWAKPDGELPGRFRKALAADRPISDVEALAGRLRDQRIAPILKHLEGVKTLFVVPVNEMAAIPVEVLAPQFTVGYVPSGTYLARAKERARPAGNAVLALGDPVFDTSSGWRELPGTRLELASLRRLFGDCVTTLAGSAASEQSLEALRKSGELARFRYLHFATHGEGNSVRAFESVLILAWDNLPKDLLSKPGEPFIDGQLSANEVLEHWKLDAELVTLSACETAIGKSGGGDGLLGFAQAFLTAGARSVCLSLWKVNDTATALLMDRFYQNLSGKREGLPKPMGKAAALAEAKDWLKNLSGDEVLKRSATLSDGVVRDKNQKAKKVVPSPADPKADPKATKPFAHPRFWAAFILVGDPS